MSVELKKVVDERIDRSALITQVHDVVKGGSNVVVQPFSTVSASASNLDFVIQTPGLGVMTSRRVNIEVDIPIQFTVTNASASAVDFVFGGAFTNSTNPVVTYGVCSMPFNSCITTAICQINTTNFNTQVGQTLPLTKRLLQDKDTRKSLWEVPTGMTHTIVQRGARSLLAQDELVTFGRPFDDVQANPRAGIVGSSNTGAYQNVSFEVTDWASAAPGDVTALPGLTTTSTQVQSAGPPIVYQQASNCFTLASTKSVTIKGVLHVVEPLLMQPFTIDDEDAMFTNTNLINVRLNLRGPETVPILRFSALDISATVGDRIAVTSMQFPSGQYWSNAKLRAVFITPPPTDNPITNCIYSTQFFNPLSTQISISGSDAIAKKPLKNGGWMDSNIITLNTAPDALAVYLVPSLSQPAAGNTGLTPIDPNETLGASMGEFVFPITDMEITWNNNPSLLATFNEIDLYRRTKENGLTFPWDTYRGLSTDSVFTLPYDFGNDVGMIGAPVILQLNKDIPVEPGVGAGTAGVYTLKIRVKARNQTNMTATQITGVQLIVCPIYSQYLVLKTGATSDLINTVATEQSVVTTAVTGVAQDKVRVGAGARMIGGAMLSSSRNKGQMGRVMDMMAAPVYSPTTQQAAQAANTYLASAGAKRPRLEL